MTTLHAVPPEDDYELPPLPMDPVAVAQTKAQPFVTLNLDDLESRPDPEWNIHGILPADAFVTVIGPPKKHKTFLALGMLLCIAAGIPFHGRPVRQGLVLYAAGEGLAGLKLRVQAFLLAHPEVDREEVLKNFLVIPRAVRLTREEEVAQLRATCRLHADRLRVVAIDTWARAMLGADENSAQEVGEAIAVCEEVRKETGATVLVVHHSNADGRRARGSTALLGAVEVEISVRHNDAEQVEVECTAMKDAAPFETMHFEPHFSGSSIVLKPTAERTGVPIGARQAQQAQRHPAAGYSDPFAGFGGR